VNSLESKAARVPTPKRPRRMERLATLPLFFPLEGRRAVVVGGTDAAAWKAELLSAAGANVEVLACDVCAEMEMLADDPPGGPVILTRTTWSRTCFEDTAVVVAATEDDAEAASIFAAAKQAGVPVNVIDRPEFCSFRFGSIVNRSPLVVGISTGGAAPVFGQAIRSRIEALLPAGFARWAAAAREWRSELKRLRLSLASRRRFWERFTDIALLAPDRAPSGADRDALMECAAGHTGGAVSTDHVTIVGAGPGNPELLTLKALRALRTADVILFDDLVAPEILDFARREAKRMLVGKTGYGPSCKQEDINALMIALARTGKRVVRLKAGDPLIFGRAGEEVAALEQAGIPVEIVPGITAAQGAAASLNKSLTQRGRAQRVQFITGHSCTGGLPGEVDIAAIADPRTTTAVYMPLGTLQKLVTRLQTVGMSVERGVTAIFNATRHNEQTVSGTLETICAEVGVLDGGRPCLVLIEAETHTEGVTGSIPVAPTITGSLSLLSIKRTAGLPQ
jgi:uroporphyrin-III C-methyltransferase/precorrin-2 dehydrogenase/sirohydrochlorin ferrochelatase